jgi:beta-phosphoglucomutase family hydrolase
VDGLPRATEIPVALGIPPQIQACLFDLDGVLTQTAGVHAAAWKELFDGFLLEWSQRASAPFVPFDIVKDYELYVDGKPRRSGTRSFLEARGIRLPEGAADDPPGAETIVGLSKRKDDSFLRLLGERGVAVYEGSVRYVKEVRNAGLRTAVVSSSRNCRMLLGAARIADLFDGVVDGVLASEQGLAGKPAPDTYLAAARLLEVPAPRAAVFEDALAGVEAGRAGRFGYVVGVDRLGQAEELRLRGADVVVTDLSDLLEPPAPGPEK